MAKGLVLPYLDVPLQHSHPDVLKRMKRPASGEKTSNVSSVGANLSRDRDPQHLHCWFSGPDGRRVPAPAGLCARSADPPRGLFRLQRVTGATANELPGILPLEVRAERQARFMAVAEEVSMAVSCNAAWAPPCRSCWWTRPRAMGHKGGAGRAYADAPEIDGTVQLLPPEKISKQLKVGEFTKARIVAVQGHDLVALPI